MKVKICGITTLEDALASLDAGCDLLGFNFYPPSPRFIKPETCAEMVQAIRSRGYATTLVGVFVNAGESEIRSILQSCGLDLAQLCGDEPPALLEALGERALKALRPKDALDLADLLLRYTMRSFVPATLIDAYRPGEYGGTGLKADWSLAQALASRLPVLLAGGLTPENVAEAVHQVQPWGVDVASGVESSPGRKDPARVAAFIHSARS